MPTPRMFWVTVYLMTLLLALHGGGGTVVAQQQQAAATTTVPVTPQHTTTFLSDTYRLEWTIVDGDSVIITMSAANNPGWVCVAWPETFGIMTNADGVIGRYAGSNARVDDFDLGHSRVALSANGVRPDIDIGGTNDVTLLTSSLRAGWATYTFRRKLNTGDPHDRVLTAGSIPTNVATGQSPTIEYHGQTRVASRITFNLNTVGSGSTGGGGGGDVVEPTQPGDDDDTSVVDSGGGSSLGAGSTSDDPGVVAGQQQVGGVQLEYEIDTRRGDMWVRASAETRGWFGFGFSPSGFMPGSQAVVSWAGVNGVREYNLGGKSVDEVSPVSPMKLSDTKVAQTNERLTSEWRRPFVDALGAPLDVNVGVSIVWAISGDNFPSLHQQFGYGNFNFADGSYTETSRFDWRLTHAIVMMIACGVCMPMGVIFSELIGRENRTLFFRWHRRLQIASTTLLLAGVAIGVTSVKQTNGLHFVNFHTGQGVVVASLAVGQVISGIFRAGLGTKHRRTWSFVHKFTGRGVVLLAILQVYAGVYHYSFLTQQSMKPWLITYSVMIIPLLLLGP